MGSGTSTIAALSDSGNFIGIEKEKTSVEIVLKAVESFKNAKRAPDQMGLMLSELEAMYESQRSLAIFR